MYDWIYSFTLAIFFVTIFFFGEILRQVEIEDKTIKEGIKHLTSRCDYRIMLFISYIFTTAVVAACLYNYI